MIKQKRKPIIIILCFSLIVGMLFNLQSVKDKVYAAEAPTQYSKEEIFKGIFFGIGEYGEKVYNDTPLTISESKEERDFLETVDHITEYIKKENPSYLDDLSATIYSKNPNKINEQLQKGGEILNKALTEPTNNLTVEGSKALNSWLQGTGLCLVLAIYVVVWKYVKVTSSPPSDMPEPKTAMHYLDKNSSKSADTFTKEQLVHNIIVAL
ncbi:hypothetical protein [Bacillus paranthracis]|uniref:hypothetical protein n=1 Tax=Bacillus paranthracis TaxID=2026186 RepID=UPI00225B53D0|nr:hypothetical protein [Bacillus paranthracis]